MVESRALLKLRSPKGYRGFESLPHRHRFFILDVRFLKDKPAADRNHRGLGFRKIAVENYGFFFPSDFAAFSGFTSTSVALIV